MGNKFSKNNIVDKSNSLDQNTIKNSQFFYTGCDEGGLKQYSINDQSLENDFGKPFKQGVFRMVKTPDDKYFVIGCYGGY